MANQIQYGPHLFPGNPEWHIRVGNTKISQKEAHKNILQNLVLEFSEDVSGSIIHQLGLEIDQVDISFMSYGNTQLVYLNSINNHQFAALVNQPHTPLGVVKEEYDHLQRLVEIDPRFVVKPFAYGISSVTNYELYISEYMPNAMCITVDKVHGIYDPLPKYHFEKFSPKMSSRVNSSMIALLVNYHRNGNGISKTQISGDDFLLTRDFKKEDTDSVQPNIRLIAARGFINTTLDEYIDLLSSEFLLGTNREDVDVVNKKIKINTRSKLPMTKKEIEEEVELGLKLRD